MSSLELLTVSSKRTHQTANVFVPL